MPEKIVLTVCRLSFSQTTAQIPDLLQVISPERRKHILSFKHEKDRLRSLFAELMLRYALTNDALAAAYESQEKKSDCSSLTMRKPIMMSENDLMKDALSSTLPPLVFSYGPHGKPALAASDNPALSAREIPALSAREIPPLSTREIPALSAREIPALSAREIPPLFTRDNLALSSRNNSDGSAMNHSDSFRNDFGSFREKQLAEASPPLYFNLSHSGDYVACVISSSECGVDIQIIRPVRDSLPKKNLSKEELEDLLRFDGDARKKRFFEYWVLKEAYIKATGQGLSFPLKKAAFQIGEDGLVKLISPAHDSAVFKSTVPVDALHGSVLHDHTLNKAVAHSFQAALVSVACDYTCAVGVLK